MRLLLVLVALAAACSPAAHGSAVSPPAPTEALVVRTGSGPCGAAVRDDALWVGGYGAGTVLQVDSRTGRITRRVAIGRWACRVAVGPSGVWVTRDNAGEIVRVDRRTGRRRRVNVGTGPFDVLLAAGSIWATSFDTGIVARLDPRSGRLQAAARDGLNPAGLAFCGGRIWVGHGRRATWLTAIAPKRMRVDHVDVGARAPAIPRCIRGELWVTTPDSVLRVDARTGTAFPASVSAGRP